MDLFQEFQKTSLPLRTLTPELAVKEIRERNLKANWELPVFLRLRSVLDVPGW